MAAGIILLSFALSEYVLLPLIDTILAYILLFVILLCISLVYAKGAHEIGSLPLAVNHFHPWAGENPDRLESFENLGNDESEVAAGIDVLELAHVAESVDSKDNTMESPNIVAYVLREEEPDEASDRAEVNLWTPEKGWFNPGEIPVHIARNTLSTNWVLVSNDTDGTRLGDVVDVAKSRMQWFSQLINLAIMQGAIVNGGTLEDAFQDAREREEDDSGLLEREWEKTTPGSLSNEDLLTGGLREALRKRGEMRNIVEADVDVELSSDFED
ncbi:MAG: hypothetical protein NZ737_03210 [Candidatus Poseidoniaceae archaeon]|nr:hypothetical protein [Candidatus Poseidoniaceae archaeon]